MITKLTNTGFTIICINPLNPKLHVLLHACIKKTDIKFIDPHTFGRFLKTTGNVRTPYYIYI